MWTFKQRRGELDNPAGEFVEFGYAGGDKGLHPEARNNPAYQFVKNLGPLPQGMYTMGDPVEGSPLGPLAIPLTPDASNRMEGRGGFYCHGDHIGAPGTASDGCMIFSHATRLLLSTSSDKRLQVTA